MSQSQQIHNQHRGPEKSVLIMEAGNGDDIRRNSSWFRKQSASSFLEPVLDLGRRLSTRFNGTRDFNQTRRRARRSRKESTAPTLGNNQVPVPGLHGPRQLSVDIDKGVVILEVPDKTNQGTMWKFLSHYSGVLRKYFGMNKVEAEARVRANSGIDHLMSIHLTQNHRPRSIEDLCHVTKFNKTEVKHLYRIFKTECPTGILTEERFHTIFSSFFPWGDEPYQNSVGNYSHYVFSLMDINDTGRITFQDFLVTLSILERGTIRERMEWVARLYDLDGDGLISADELEDVIFSVFDLMGKGKENESILRIAVRAKIRNMLEDMNINEDRQISLKMFSDYCLTKC